MEAVGQIPVGSAAAARIRRAVVALALLGALGVALGYLTKRPHYDRPPPAFPSRAVSHEVAAASQNIFPTTYSEALDRIDRELAIDIARAAPSGGGWLAQTMVAGGYLRRAKLTGSFADYHRAGQAYARAFAVADPGFGPHLERAAYNFTIHRLGKVEPDLARIEGYAVPVDGVTRATMIGLRGDLLFYRGRYTEALDHYERSRALHKSMPTSFRLAVYWSKMGDPDLALRYISEAESNVAGADQQTLSFLELHRGIIALDRGRWDKAERHFRRADAIFPGHWLIEEHLAEVTLLQGHLDRAQRLYESIVRRTGNPEFMDALAAIHHAKGEDQLGREWTGRARVLWEQRLKILPEAAYGHALDHFMRLADPRRALAIAQLNTRLRPFGEAQIGLARAYLKAGRMDDARAVIEPVLASGWSTADGHVAAHDVYAALEEHGLAEAQRKKALAINPHAFDGASGSDAARRKASWPRSREI